MVDSALVAMADSPLSRSRSRSIPFRLLIGSVSEAVVRRTNVPTALVR